MQSAPAPRTFDTLGDLLDAVAGRTEGGRPISVAELQDIVGSRAFGPLLLLPGLLAVTPVSGIPTVPSLIGIVVMIVSAQVALGRRDVWLPQRLARGTVRGDRLEKALRFARPAARVVDKVVRRRLVFATEGLGLRLAALACLLTAITMPPLEIMPFAATGAGAVIAAFGLAITVHDGLLMLAAVALLGTLMVGGYLFFT